MSKVFLSAIYKKREDSMPKIVNWNRLYSKSGKLKAKKSQISMKILLKKISMENSKRISKEISMKNSKRISKEILMINSNRISTKIAIKI